MKIPKEHYEQIKNEFSRLSIDNLKSHWESLEETQKIQTQKIGDIDRRFRWDCFYACRLSSWACKTLYPIGINDNHIDTALARIVKELGLPSTTRK